MEEQIKKQSRMMQIMAASCVGVFIIVLVSALILVPKAINAMDMISEIQLDLDQESMEKLTTDVDELIVTLNEELQQMTDQLSQVDVENLNTAIKNLSEAVEKMDIEELNRAITNLSDIIEPLARLMN
ncbi:hypothetical protein NDGK_01202 [Clostridiales bacterium CHKCI001]|nr:hypothetical protein NDGK_01202 [Clostridiales bacterium CHKCI001]